MNLYPLFVFICCYGLVEVVTWDFWPNPLNRNRNFEAQVEYLESFIFS